MVRDVSSEGALIDLVVELVVELVVKLVVKLQATRWFATFLQKALSLISS